MKIEMNKWPRLWHALGHTVGNNTKSQSKLCYIDAESNYYPTKFSHKFLIDLYTLTLI